MLDAAQLDGASQEMKRGRREPRSNPARAKSPAKPKKLTGTALKVEQFQAACLRDPAAILEHAKERLARGAKPGQVTEKWNSADPDLLVDAKLKRDAAVAIVIDRAIAMFIERDTAITPDVAAFIRRLNLLGRTSKRTTRKVLTDIAKRLDAMLAEAPAWPSVAKERRALRKYAEIEFQGSRVPTYRDTPNRQIDARKPTENCGLNSGMDRDSRIVKNRVSAESDLLSIPPFLDRRPPRATDAARQHGTHGGGHDHHPR